MGSFDRWADLEHRRRLRGVGLAVALMIIALLIPTTTAAQEWGKTQILWLSALFMAFQFGQVWQAMRMSRARSIDQIEQFHSRFSASAAQQRAQARPSSPVPASTPSHDASPDARDGYAAGTATMAAATPDLAVRARRSNEPRPASASEMAHENRSYLIDEDRIEIRAYASIEEAQRHGWVFGPAVAVFSEQPVPGSATLGAKTYIYSGLAPLRNTGLVAPDARLFGALSYRLQRPAPVA